MYTIQIIIAMVMTLSIVAIDNDPLSEIVSFNSMEASYQKHIEYASKDPQYRASLCHQLLLIRTQIVHIDDKTHGEKIIGAIKNYQLTAKDLQDIHANKLTIQRYMGRSPTGELIAPFVINIGEKKCSECSK